MFVLHHCFEQNGALSLRAHPLNPASWKLDAIMVQLRSPLKYNSCNMFPLPAFHRNDACSVFVEGARSHWGRATWNIKYSGIATGKLLIYTWPEIQQDNEGLIWGTVEILLGSRGNNVKYLQLFLHYYMFLGTSKQSHREGHYIGTYLLAKVVLCIHQSCVLLCFMSWAAPVCPQDNTSFYPAKPFQVNWTHLQYLSCTLEDSNL